MLNKIKNIYIQRANERFLVRPSLTFLLFAFPFVMPILRLMQKLNLKIHPNVITLASFPFALSAAYFFFDGRLVIGALCYFIYYALDTIDGKWARLTGQTSELGERLDYFVGALGNLAMYFGLWYSQYYLKGDWLIGGSIVVAHYIIVVCILIFLQQPYYKTIFPRVRSYYSLQEEGFGTFFLAPLFNVVTVLFPLLVMFQLISFIIFLIRQKERPDVKKRIKEDLLKIYSLEWYIPEPIGSAKYENITNIKFF